MIRIFGSLPPYVQASIGGSIVWTLLLKVDERIANYWAGMLTVLVAFLAVYRPNRGGGGGGGGWEAPDAPPPSGYGVDVPRTVTTREVSALTADELIAKWATTPAESESTKH